MKKNKHYFVFLLTLLITFLLISEPLCIIASESNKGVKPITEWTPSEWTKLCYYLGSKIGAVGDSISDAVKGWVEGNFTADGMREKFDDFKSGVSVKDGKVVVSSDALNNFKGLIDSAIEDCGDYLMVDTYSPKDAYVLQFTGKMNSQAYTKFIELVKDEYFGIHLCDNFGSNYFHIDYSHFDSISTFWVLYPPGGIDEKYLAGFLYPFNSNGDKITTYKKEIQYYYSSDRWSEPFEQSAKCNNFCVPSSTGTWNEIGRTLGSPLVTIDGHKIKVFKSSAALRNYLHGTSANNIYFSSTYIDYDVNNDNSISIDASTVDYIFQQGDSYQLDMSKVINNVTNEINNYFINNGSSMSEDMIQKLIDESLQKLLDSLPSGGGEEPSEPETETETETETGGGDISGNDISGNDVSGNGVDGPQTVSLLQKILDKLSEIKKAIIGNTITGGLGDLISTGLDKLIDFADSVKDSVVSVVPEVSDMVSDIIDGTEETIGKMVDNVGTNMRPVGDKMKTKFPFSIPWDIAAVVGSMSAAPETPVFELPIVFERYNIDYTLTIDMSDFEVISKISRLFLSLTFILFLTKLTVQVVKMEKEL